MKIGRIAAVAAGLVAGFAQAQVSAVLSSSSDTPAPGDTITVTLSAEGAPAASGPFGSGVFGFGGSIDGTGMGMASMGALDADLSELNAAGMMNGLSFSDIGGTRVRNGSLSSASEALFSFDVMVPGDAMDGDQLTFAFDGTVLVAAADTIESYASNPGPGQNPLTTPTLTVTVSASSANPLDFDGNGVVNISDLFAFITAFTMTPPDPATDFDGNGVINISDLFAFITAFTAAP